MKPTEEQHETLHNLLRFLVKHRPSENHSVHLDPRGEILTQVWPHRVPTQVYVRMKEDAELDHLATR